MSNTISETYQITKIYENGDRYLLDIVEALGSATKSIYIESYIFELPEPGRQVLEILERKLKDGIEVKVLVDGVGSLHHTKALQAWAEQSCAEFKIYNPIPWPKYWRVLLFPFFVFKIVLKRRIINRRDHRKVVIIDSKIAFLGSFNFSRVHFATLSENPWFDLGVQLRGSLIIVLEKAFLKSFNRSPSSAKEFFGEVRAAFKHRPYIFPLGEKIRLNSNFILRFLYWRDLLRRIRHAKSRVYIMNAYFVPHRTLVRSLAVAVRKNVEVVLMLPSETDVPLVKWFAPIFYRRLIKEGVQICELQNQILHTKSVIIDDWAIVGSNNLNYRSLLHDLEVDAVIDEDKMLGQLLAIWDKKRMSCRVVQGTEVMKLSVVSWLKYRFVLLFRYFI